MGSRISIAIMVVIVLGVALYVFQSGSFSTGGKQSSGFFQSLLPHFTPSTSTALKFSQGNVVPPAPRATSTVVTPATSSTRAPINPLDIPPGYTESQLSPYFHRIRFGGISSQSISLNAYLGSGVPTSTTIDVTGWQIKSNRGGEFLPQAVNLYDPLGLAPATDILLKNGDTLNLYPTSAPVNLRMNACMGYLPNKSQFKPQLPQNCPYVDRSKFQAFSGACQNYIQSLGGCQLPNLADTRIPQNDYACRDYLSTHFNYRSCFEEHQADANFLSREVRVWMGKSPMDPFHDRVSLLDRDGLLVDYRSF